MAGRLTAAATTQDGGAGISSSSSSSSRGMSPIWPAAANSPGDDVTSPVIVSDTAKPDVQCIGTLDSEDRGRNLEEVFRGETSDEQQLKSGEDDVDRRCVDLPNNMSVDDGGDGGGGDGGTVDILLENIVPYLNRLSFQNLSVLSKDTHYHSQFVSAPWPSDNDHYRICPSSRIYRLTFEPSLQQYQTSLATTTAAASSASSSDRNNGVMANVGSQTIAMGGYNGYVYLWNLKHQKYHVLERHQGPVAYMTYSQNGSVLATCSYDGPVRIWRTSSPSPSRSRSKNSLDDHGYRLVRIVRQLKTTATNTSNLAFNNTNDGQGEAYSAITSLALSPDGTVLAAGCLNSSTHDQYQIVLWDISLNVTNESSCRPIIIGENSDGDNDSNNNSRPIYVIRGQGLWVKSIQFAPDGKSLLAISGSTHVRIWDLHGHGAAALSLPVSQHQQTPPPTILEGHSGRVNSVTFSPNGQYIATASDDGTIRVWTATVMAPDDENPNGEQHRSTATTITDNSNDGRYQCTMVFPHPYPVRSLSFAPNCKYLVSACSGAASATTPTATAATAVTTDESGRRSNGHNCLIKVWNLVEGTCPHTIPGPADDSIMSLNVSPDGQVVVFVGFDGSIGFRHCLY